MNKMDIVWLCMGFLIIFTIGGIVGTVVMDTSSAVDPDADVVYAVPPPCPECGSYHVGVVQVGPERWKTLCLERFCGYIGPGDTTAKLAWVAHCASTGNWVWDQ